MVHHAPYTLKAVLWCYSLAAAAIIATGEALGASVADVAVILSGVFAGSLPALFAAILAHRKAASAQKDAHRALKRERRLYRLARRNERILQQRQPAWDALTVWIASQADSAEPKNLQKPLNLPKKHEETEETPP